jgi:hypothetical protein
MAKVSDIYAGDFITAAELPRGQRVVAVIIGATSEVVGQDSNAGQKVILSLQSRDGRNWPRRVILNKTNATVLAATFGDNTDGWLRRAIEIWQEMVSFQGRIVPGMRMAPAVPAAAAAEPRPQRPTEDGLGTALATRLAAPASAPPPPASGIPTDPPQPVGEIIDDEIPF